MAIDLVCFRTVDKKTAKEKTVHEGITYYFCSKNCRVEFEASPENYISGDDGDDLVPA